MSSTNRGSKRQSDDRYFTRYPCARAIVEQLVIDGIFDPDAKSFLEPSCGKGAFVGAMRDVLGPEKIIDAVDLVDQLLPCYSHELSTVAWTDFLTFRSAYAYDGIIGNPPYSNAEAHVRHALTLLKDEKSALVMLLRVNFLAGIERQGAFYRDHQPEYVYVLDKRPPFLDKEDAPLRSHGDDGHRLHKNDTDSCEYGVFVWRKQRSEFEPTLRFLNWSSYLPKYGGPWRLSVDRQWESKLPCPYPNVLVSPPRT